MEKIRPILWKKVTGNNTKNKIGINRTNKLVMMNTLPPEKSENSMVAKGKKENTIKADNALTAEITIKLKNIFNALFSNLFPLTKSALSSSILIFIP